MCSAAWEMVMDNESGDYFYRKMATGEIRWDKPSFYEAPEGSITDKTNQSASELLKLANERLLHLRNNRPKVESTDWPIVLPSGNRYEGQIRQCKSSFFFLFSIPPRRITSDRLDSIEIEDPVPCTQSVSNNQHYQHCSTMPVFVQCSPLFFPLSFFSRPKKTPRGGRDGVFVGRSLLR